MAEPWQKLATLLESSLFYSGPVYAADRDTAHGKLVAGPAWCAVS